MGSDSLPQFSKPTSQLKVSPGTRCQREEDREGQPPGVELTAMATRTRATATAVGSRRATPTPMPTAPPTTTMGPHRLSISSQRRHERINDKDTDHQRRLSISKLFPTSMEILPFYSQKL